MRAGNLEYVVEKPLMRVSNSPGIMWAFVGATYVCIVLTIIQVIFAILAWQGKQRSLVERLYYSLATLTASGYLLLLGSWGLIAALYKRKKLATVDRNQMKEMRWNVKEFYHETNFAIPYDVYNHPGLAADGLWSVQTGCGT